MIKSFLTYVAEDIYKRYGADLSRLTVVFPNKRAALFLNQELARMAEKPIWAPAYVSISELFRSRSQLSIANPIQSVCLLHKSYTSVTGIDETLDHFFGWGQLLLADFDDIDKNMADAQQLFHNVRDLHELDSIEYLDEEQKQLIMRFFGNFTGDETQLRKKFISLWSNLYNVYADYRQRLRERGLAYEGMLYRDVVEHDKGELPGDHYLFVGFNVLQKVEQRLFDQLREEGRAAFYWDYDYYYTHLADHEAGTYVRQWPSSYPNALDDADEDLYGQLGREKRIRFLSAPTENLQARYISTWLRENERYKDGKRTAVVLCDEHLLPTVIHSIPSEVEMVNVTTGYPLQQTPIASFLTQLIAVQTDGFSLKESRYKLAFIERVLRHPYAKFVSPLVTDLLARLIAAKRFYISREDLSEDEGLHLIFRELPNGPLGEVDALQLTEWLAEVTRSVAMGGPNGKAPLFQESVFRMFTTLQQLAKLIADGDLDADLTILRRLITQLVGATSVPFHGEPARGVQVMGVLETRNLDFDHVLILSCNEGNMPKGVDDASFIPHALRAAYGLTTIDNKVSIYSYYFHTLLQRATDVTIAYNSCADGLRAGEMSRFMLQLMVEWPHNIEKITLQAGQEPQDVCLVPVTKDNHVMSVLHGFGSISPSALSTYLRCQLRFFYAYVVGLSAPDDNDAEAFSAIHFGNIFHRAAELVYEQLLPRERIEAEDLQRLIQACRKTANNPLQVVVRQAIAEEFFHLGKGATTHPKLNGLQLLNEEVIKKYLVRLLETDLKVAPLRIIAHEATAYARMQSPEDSPKYNIRVGGRIDRIDEVLLGTRNQQLRVVDYKTGNSQAKSVAALPDVFNPAKIPDYHIDYQLQVMLYSLLIDGHAPQLNPQHRPVSPALLFIQYTSDEDYSPILRIGETRITDMGSLREEFDKELHRLLGEIFDPSVPFAPNDHEKECGSCPFKSLCGKAMDVGSFGN